MTWTTIDIDTGRIGPARIETPTMVYPRARIVFDDGAATIIGPDGHEWETTIAYDHVEQDLPSGQAWRVYLDPDTWWEAERARCACGSTAPYRR